MTNMTNCAFCNGKVQLTIERRAVTMRFEEIEYDDHFYRCDTCREEFHDETLGDINLKQIYDEYKKRHPEWQHPYEKNQGSAT